MRIWRTEINRSHTASKKLNIHFVLILTSSTWAGCLWRRVSVCANWEIQQKSTAHDRKVGAPSISLPAWAPKASAYLLAHYPQQTRIRAPSVGSVNSKTDEPHQAGLDTRLAQLLVPPASYLQYTPLGHINFCHREETGQWNLNGLFLFIDTISWQEQFSELIFHSIEFHVTANESSPRSVRWQNTVVSALCFIWIKSSGYYQI